MKNIQQINQFIWEIDNQSNIEKFGFYVDGLFIPFWVLIRQMLSLELEAKLGYGPSRDSKLKSSWVKKINFFFNAYRHRPKLGKAEFLFISPSIGNVDYGDKVENIFHDLFAQALVDKGNNVLILEQSNNLWHPFKKRNFNLIAYSLTWLHLKRKINTLLFSYFKKVSHHKVNDFIVFLDSLLEKKINDRFFLIHNVKNFLLHMIKNAKYYIKMWEKIARVVQPKMVMMQDICGGGSAAIASLVFKRNHTIVIEDQHGFIDSEDTKFNYNENLITKEIFSRYFPDYFLFYGKRWLQNTNVKTKKVVIGNPYHSVSKEKIHNRNPQYDLLVISDSTRPNFTIKTINVLLNTNYKILFRPHPVELTSAYKRYNVLLNHNRITLDTDRDVYQSFLNSKIVICIVGNCVSTVVCEAIAFRKPVLCYADNLAFLRGKEMFLDHVKFYEQDTELLNNLNLIINNDSPTHDQIENLYSSNWKKNFLEFISNPDFLRNKQL